MIDVYDDEEMPILASAMKKRKGKFRSRVKELRHVRAGDILPNPKNWRTHPFSQRNALRSVLSEIGFADAVIARETAEGLMLIDGHARVNEVSPDDVLPVLVVDLDDHESDLMLATLDPLAAMAETDDAMLKELARSLVDDNTSLTKLLDAMQIRYDDIPEDEREERTRKEKADKQQQRRDDYAYEYRVIIHCKNEKQQVKLIERFEKEGLECQALIL